MRPERRLSTIPHSLQRYILVLRTRLPTLAVRYLVQADTHCAVLCRRRCRKVGVMEFAFNGAYRAMSPLVIGWRVRARSHVVTDAVTRCLLQCVTACPLASSSKNKPCQFSSVQLRRSVCMRFKTTHEIIHSEIDNHFISYLLLNVLISYYAIKLELALTLLQSTAKQQRMI